VVELNAFADLFAYSANLAISSALAPVTILISFNEEFKSCAYPKACYKAPMNPCTRLEDNCHLTVFFNVYPKSLTLEFKFKTYDSEDAILLANCKKAYCP
jgi:hypothetical protein